MFDINRLNRPSLPWAVRNHHHVEIVNSAGLTNFLSREAFLLKPPPYRGQHGQFEALTPDRAAADEIIPARQRQQTRWTFVSSLYTSCRRCQTRQLYVKSDQLGR